MKFLENKITSETILISGAALSGIIHLYVGLTMDLILVFLAGTGFFVGASIFLLGYFRNVLAAVSIPYTAIQFVFYYQSYGLNFGPLGVADKIIQTFFILTALYYLNKKFSESEDLKDLLLESGKGPD